MEHGGRLRRLEEEHGEADLYDEDVDDVEEENLTSRQQTAAEGGTRPPPPPSNEKLLCIAFVSFQSFAIAQTVAAWIAGSEAMMGDSAAMMVDAWTYLFNWYAERRKGYYARKLQLYDPHDALTLTTQTHSPHPAAALKYKKYTYQLEVVPPLLTVGTLLVVIGLVLKHAIHILILDANRDVSEQADPNVNLMLIFSFINLLLDVLNVFCFAQASHALGYSTEVVDDLDQEVTRVVMNVDRNDIGYSDQGPTFSDNQGMKNITNEKGGSTNGAEHGGRIPLEFEDRQRDHTHYSHSSSQHGKDKGSNLNMCSAYTHIFADTLRSLAVIVAATLADIMPAVTAEEADAWAAVVVSILILLSLVPLLRGMVQTYFALQHVNQILDQAAKDEASFSDDDDNDNEGLSLMEMQTPISRELNESGNAASIKRNSPKSSKQKANVAFV